ncbi:hypothetical protein [Planctomycetes bacterium K23_9]|uniref:Uncharacterized protein n=1 Tax=Stieleria marina TaxID=1930275 RepID=A0A517P1R0_9BACT|nr:hypothetical protein K239x_53370 [Planctomycetes bacterium K23_9]
MSTAKRGRAQCSRIQRNQIQRNQIQRNQIRNSRTATKRRGYAMILVMVIILSSSAFVAVHQRNLSAALRIEQARILSEEHRRGPVSVLAVACSRMETGDPPAPIQYRYEHIVNGVPTLYRISYSNVATEWTVNAVPDAGAVGLTELPASF